MMSFSVNAQFLSCNNQIHPHFAEAQAPCSHPRVRNSLTDSSPSPFLSAAASNSSTASLSHSSGSRVFKTSQVLQLKRSEDTHKAWFVFVIFVLLCLAVSTAGWVMMRWQKTCSIFSGTSESARTCDLQCSHHITFSIPTAAPPLPTRLAKCFQIHQCQTSERLR